MTESIRVAGKTKEQLDWLKANGYESITNAASVAVDRLYQSERSSMNQDRIEVVWTEDTLWGSTDPTEYNQAESEENYTQSIINYIYADYPNAEIEVSKGNVERVAVNGQTDTNEAEAIRLLVETAWNGDDWLVASPTDYQFWDHTGSGETYAVRIVAGSITGIVGPLAYDERDPDNLDAYEYDDNPEDAEWAQTQEWRLHEPQG